MSFRDKTFVFVLSLAFLMACSDGSSENTVPSDEGTAGVGVGGARAGQTTTSDTMAGAVTMMAGAVLPGGHSGGTSPVAGNPGGTS